MLKLNIKLLIDPPKQKKLTMAHLSPSVDRDRRPCVFVLLVCPFVRPCFGASWNIVNTHIKATRYLEKYLGDFHQTYINDAMWDRDECIIYGDQKVKGQGHSEIKICWKQQFTGAGIEILEAQPSSLTVTSWIVIQSLTSTRYSVLAILLYSVLEASAYVTIILTFLLLIIIIISQTSVAKCSSCGWHFIYKPLFRHMAAQTDKQTKEMHRKTK